MNKICTSIEQSKKLIKLGIDVNTADMRYGYIAPYDFSDRMYDGGYDEVPYPKDFFKKNPDFSENEYEGELPAWSLSALINLFDDKAGLAKDYGLWYCYDNAKSHCTRHYDNSIDAAFEMIVWLKENGKI
jgi:hypothetical protein